MSDESESASPLRRTALEDLSSPLRQLLLDGYATRAWWVDSPATSVDTLNVTQRQAFEDGGRLAQAVSMVWSASVTEYPKDKADYEALCTELNTRYGDGLVVDTTEWGPDGQPPGFRRRTAAGD